MKSQSKLIQLSLAVASFFILTACSSEPLSCSDSDVQDIVKEIYVEQIQSGQNNPLLAAMTKNLPNLDSIDSIRPTSYDEDIKMRGCKAVMHFENGNEITLEYTIQTNEEDDDFYVELDTSFVESLLMSNIMKELQQ